MRRRMGVIVILMLASIGVAGVFLIGFLWALKSGQYDDAEGPAVRILFDDKPLEEDKTNTDQD